MNTAFSGSSKAIFGASFVALSINPAATIYLVRVFQSFELFSYINIQVPSIITNMIIELDISLFNSMPNFIEIDENEYSCNLHPKLQEIGVKCLAINTIANDFIFILIVAVLKMIAFIPLWWRGETNYLYEHKKVIESIIREKKLNTDKDKDKDKDCQSVYKLKKEPTSIASRSFIFSCRKVNKFMNLSLLYSVFESISIDLYLKIWPSFKALNSPLKIWSFISISFIPLVLAMSIVYLTFLLRAYLQYFQPRGMK